VVFKLAPRINQDRRARRESFSGVERRRPRLFNNKVLAEWKVSGKKELERLIGSCLAGKGECAFQGLGKDEMDEVFPLEKEEPKIHVESKQPDAREPQKPQSWKSLLKFTE
jgi:hypothetical protein